MPLKVIPLPIYSNGIHYTFEPFSGLLLSKTGIITYQTSGHDSKLDFFLGLNHQPYKLSCNSFERKSIRKGNGLLHFYVILLTKIVRLNFSLGRVLTVFGRPIFSNSNEAIAYYRKNIYPNQQNDLCLPRTLFAAATSKKFKESGVIFIGVFLPSKSMHAWIIEDGALTDPEDGIWLNYQPVATLYYE